MEQSNDRFSLRDISSISSVYGQLRYQARRLLRHERAGHTLQPTAVVHEVLVNLLGENWESQSWNDRAHFFRDATKRMQRVLIDYGKRRRAIKRFDGKTRVNLDDISLLSDDTVQEAILVEDMLMRLEMEKGFRNPVAIADAVRLKIYGGFTNDEIADWLGLPVKRATALLKLGLAWLENNHVANEP